MGQSMLVAALRLFLRPAASKPRVRMLVGWSICQYFLERRNIYTRSLVLISNVEAIIIIWKQSLAGGAFSREERRGFKNIILILHLL